MKKVEKKQLCFVGLGALFEATFEQLVCTFSSDSYFIFDNDPSKWGKYFAGFRCLRVEEFLSLPRDICIIVTVRDFENLAKTLVEFGFSDINIASFDRAEWSIKKYIKFITHTTRGNRLTDVSDDLNVSSCYVSGSCGGIGSEIAHYFAKKGVRLVLQSRSESKLLALSSQLRALGADVLTAALDLNDENSLIEHCKWIENLNFDLDLFYLNAGVSLAPSKGGFFEGNVSGWKETFQTNVIAQWYLLRAVYNRSLKQKNSIKCFVATTALRKAPESQAYTCSKAALDKLVFDLRDEFASRRIELCSIDPGWVRTAMGGDKAAFPVNSIIPGAIFAAHTKKPINVYSICAQDYRGLTINQAIDKAMLMGVISNIDK